LGRKSPAANDCSRRDSPRAYDSLRPIPPREGAASPGQRRSGRGGVRRITGGYGADIVIDGIGGEVLSEALGALAPGGSLTTLGYSASRKATIDVTNLIWQRAAIQSFILFAQPQAARD